MPLIQVSDNLDATLRAFGRMRIVLCKVDGCFKPRHRRPNGTIASSYCPMHASRMNKKGEVGPAHQLTNTHGTGCISRGYRLLRRNNRLRGEHQLVWEVVNGPIPANHVIHHVNGNKSDNRIENLRCMTQAEHLRLHRGMVVECL